MKKSDTFFSTVQVINIYYKLDGFHLCTCMESTENTGTLTLTVLNILGDSDNTTMAEKYPNDT